MVKCDQCIPYTIDHTIKQHMKNISTCTVEEPAYVFCLQVKIQTKKYGFFKCNAESNVRLKLLYQALFIPQNTLENELTNFI